MATSAFKSTTKRSPVGSSSPADSGSSNRSGQHRRSRSLSRFSGRFPPSDPDGEITKGIFLNTVRGSAFPEISLDDLANEFFLATEYEETPVEDTVRGRSGRRFSLAGGPPKEGQVASDASQRRGRSVSRNRGKGNFDDNLGLKGVSDVGSRRRRSVSVARNKCSVPKVCIAYLACASGSNRLGKPLNMSDMDQYNNCRQLSKSENFGNENFQRSTLPKPTASYHDHGLTRSLSRKDLLQSHGSYSSFSSALTDDEARDAHNKNGFEKTIRAVYEQKKTEYPAGDGEGIKLCEAVGKEVWHASEEIKTQLKQVMVHTQPTVLKDTDCSESKSLDIIQAFVEIRNKYTSKLKQSEKFTQDLLAELAVEEQCCHEFSKIVGELQSEPKQTAAPEKRSQAKKRSNDRTRMEKHPSEQEEYFKDFISNVEDAESSSFNGEKSDSSSTVGVKLTEPELFCTKTKTCETLLHADSLSVEMDGVVFPWLKWDSSNDPSFSYKSKESSVVPINPSLDAAQGWSNTSHTVESFVSSHVSFYGCECSTAVSRDKMDCRFTQSRYCSSQCATSRLGTSLFDMGYYLNLQLEEDILFERLRQGKRIDSGGLVLCHRN